jgi:hypothetical protein
VNRYDQLLSWRKAPFTGETVTIESDGRRRTWQPGHLSDDQGGRVPEIWMLGGSTAWGQGARDDGTIPSQLAQRLHQMGVVARVLNLGEGGYVSIQELTQLMLLLRERPAPALVISYDGINDVYSAYRSRGPGRIYFYREMESLVKDARRGRSSGTELAKLCVAAANKLVIGRLGGALLALAWPLEPDADAERGSWLGEEELRPFSQEIVRSYSLTIRAIARLGKTYGFEHRAAWQPVLFTEPGHPPAEAEAAAALGGVGNDEKLARLYRMVLDLVRVEMGDDPSFTDLSQALAGHTEPLYIDSFHINERGNGMVVEAMLQQMLDPLPEGLGGADADPSG